MSAHSLYRRWIEELWAGRPVADELVSSDFVGHWPDHDVHGPAELQSTVEQTRNMVRDMTFSIEIGPLVDGDYVAGRWRGRGRSDDRGVAFTGNDILRVVDGRFVEYWTGTSAG